MVIIFRRLRNGRPGQWLVVFWLKGRLGGLKRSRIPILRKFLVFPKEETFGKNGTMCWKKEEKIRLMGDERLFFDDFYMYTHIWHITYIYMYALITWKHIKQHLKICQVIMNHTSRFWALFDSPALQVVSKRNTKRLILLKGTISGSIFMWPILGTLGKTDDTPCQKWDAWRIIPVSTWLITMISKSCNWGCSPSKSPLYGL